MSYFDDYASYLIPGMWYVVDSTGMFIAETENLEEAKKAATPTDTILLAFNNKGTTEYIEPKQEVNKITIDFTNNVLTVDGSDVILQDNSYKQGENILNEDDGLSLIDCAYSFTDNVEVIGTVKMKDAKDITYLLEE